MSDTKKAEPKRPPHLSDLFKTGMEIKFDVEIEGEDAEIIIWMRKPVTAQHQEAMAKARGKQARIRRQFKDHDSDQFVAMEADVDEMEDVDMVIDAILRFESQRLRNTAYNEVLYDKEYAPKDDEGELVWGDDGVDYLALLVGITDRMDEIRDSNEKLSEDDQHLLINLSEDDELIKLSEQQNSFDDVVEERFNVLNEEERQQFVVKKMTELRKIFMKKMIDTETSLGWYEEYRMYMLWFACRMPDDHANHYFHSAADVLQLPPHLLNYLYDQLDILDGNVDSAKNSLSLQLSSSS